MRKYISKFDSVSEAIEATNLHSPQVSYVVESDKLLNLDCGDNEEVRIIDNIESSKTEIIPTSLILSFGKLKYSKIR